MRRDRAVVYDVSAIPQSDGDLRAAYVARDYGFLGDLIPTHEVHGVRRAEGTFALASHLGYRPGRVEGLTPPPAS